MKDIGFIGMGNMGYAIFCSLTKAFDKSSLTYTDPNMERMEYVKKETGVDYTLNNIECVKSAKYIVLAVKPQIFDNVLTEIKDYVTKEHIIISIGAGISISNIKGYFDNDIKVVRSMPNTPALIGEGMTGVSYYENDYSNDEKSFINKFFSSFGKFEVVDEKLMNAIVCANGSSPAYVYMFIESLADSVVKYGIPRDMAYRLTAQTVLGAAKIVLETNEHPGKLKDQVCSPGGTTIEAVSALEEYGFRNSIIKATDRCYEKAQNLTK